MTGTDTGHGVADGLPCVVRPGEVSGLVAAYRRAQAAEVVVVAVLARCGIAIGDAQPVATLNDHGEPIVRLTLTPADHAAFVRELRALGVCCVGPTPGPTAAA
jgi:hypothetical protein